MASIIKKTKLSKICALACILFVTATAHAQLSVEKISKTIGRLGGEDLSITIDGTGFDSDTRIMMVPDVGNRHQRIASLGMPLISQYITAISN